MSDISKLGAFNQALGALAALGLLSAGAEPVYVGMFAALMGAVTFPALIRVVRVRYRTGITIG